MGKELLKIELIPSTCAGQNLRSVLSAWEWQKISLAVREHANLQCEICKTKVKNISQLEAHEEWKYVKEETKSGKIRRIQKLKDIKAICTRCHWVKHAGFAIQNEHTEAIIAHYSKVNKAPPNEFLKAYDKAMEKCDRRSKHKWKLRADIDAILKKKFEKNEDYER